MLADCLLVRSGRRRVGEGCLSSGGVPADPAPAAGVPRHLRSVGSTTGCAGGVLPYLVFFSKKLKIKLNQCKYETEAAWQIVVVSGGLPGTLPLCTYELRPLSVFFLLLLDICLS